MYKINIPDDGSDSVSSQIRAILSGSAKTLFWFYHGIIKDLVLQYATNSDKKYNFINNQLGWLELKSTKENLSITFDLKEEGKVHFKTEIKKSKIGYLQSYFDFIHDNKNREDVYDVYNDNTLYKEAIDFNLVDSAAEIKTKFKAGSSDGLDDQINTLNGYLDTLLSLVPRSQSDLQKIIDSKDSLDKKKQAIRSYLNNSDIHEDIRMNLMESIFDQMAQQCKKSKKAIRNFRNKKRLNLIEQTLRTVTETVIIPGSKEFDEKLNELKKEYAEKVKNHNLEAKHFDTNNALLYSDFEKVLRPALKRQINHLSNRIGAANLKLAKDLEFNEELERGRLIPMLLSLINEVLAKVEISVLWDNAGTEEEIEELKNLRLYIPYEWNDYKKALGKIGPAITNNDINSVAQTLNTQYANSLNIPLVKLDEDGVEFYNCEPQLYLNDPKNFGKLFQFNEKNVQKSVALTRDFSTFSSVEDQKIAIKNTLSNSSDFPTSFKFQRIYESLYILGLTPNTLGSHLMWHKSSGMGHGIGRADEVERLNYIWSFAGNTEYFSGELEKILMNFKKDKFEKIAAKVMGTYVGLDMDRYVKLDYINDIKNQTNVTADNEFQYQFISWALDSTEELKYYVKCNTPFLTNSLRTSLGTIGTKENTLDKFQILYFRRVGLGDINKLETQKVLKAISNHKNKPQKEDVKEKDEKFIGLNLPVCFHVDANYEKFHMAKKDWGVIKNKGNFLTTNPNLREDAGKVMKEIAKYSVHISLSRASLPATEMTKIVVSKTPGKDDWQKLKLSKQIQIPTDQEWCHLRGHGDGGKERVGNFVSGSKHCNTEQLAIESAQRITTHQPGLSSYILNSTAYLIKDDSMGLLAGSHGTQSYISEDPRPYFEALENYKSVNKSISEANRNKDLENTKNNAPVSKFIRYKILHSPTSSPSTKIFDYVFEGQSEFFDKNQYNILNYTIRFLLDYENFMNELADFYRLNYMNK